MSSINLRDIDSELHARFKIAAFKAKKSFKQWCLDVLATSIAAEVPVAEDPFNGRTTQEQIGHDVVHHGKSKPQDYGIQKRNGPVGRPVVAGRMVK